jgi:hypothetical protein
MRRNAKVFAAAVRQDVLQRIASAAAMGATATAAAY